MKKIIIGVSLCLIGSCLIVLNSHVTTLLLGGPPKVKQSVWIEDRQVFTRVSGHVKWSGWTLLMSGLVVMSYQVILRHMNQPKSAPWR